jgi:hypothetical protein
VGSFGANAKARFSKTEAHFGSALAPNLPILVSNDGRLLPQTFEGGTIQSKEIDNLTINAGQLTHAMGRARATVPVCRSPVPMPTATSSATAAWTTSSLQT